MLMTQAADGQEGLKEMFEESEIQELKELVLAERSEDRLAHLAQLDACVTVIDALNFFNTFEDDRFKSNKLLHHLSLILEKLLSLLLFVLFIPFCNYLYFLLFIYRLIYCCFDFYKEVMRQASAHFFVRL